MGADWEEGKGVGGLYLFLEMAIIITPSIPMPMAGAVALLVVSAKKVHAANARQRIPTISLSFLT